MRETPAYLHIDAPMFAAVGQEVNLIAALEATVRAFDHMCDADEVRRATQWLAERYKYGAEHSGEAGR